MLIVIASVPIMNLRQRESLVAAASKCIQHMQKALTQMNLQLAIWAAAEIFGAWRFASEF
jgi:hypothetical protein